jgi:N-glycosylase/DNA lyase
MELKLQPIVTPFNLGHTMQCGQLFRWQQHGDYWYGIVEDRVLRVRQSANVLEFEGAGSDSVRTYFRLDDSFGRILAEISKDSLVNKAVQLLSGLRIVRQSPWECLISYICATHKSIPAIKSMIANLSKRFGQRLTFENSYFFKFP